MFDIVLYEFAKKYNSTKQPQEGGTTYTGEFKSSSSMLSPVVALYRGPSGTAAPVNKNYAYIAEFDRYYFVRDWVFDGGLWVAYLECDLLATWRYRIGHTNFYVLRSSVPALHDGFIIDHAWPDKVDNSSTYEEGFTLWDVTLDYPAGLYIVGVIAGGSNAPGFVTYYLISSANDLAQLGRELFVNADFGDLGDVTEDLVKAIANPAEFIVSCKWFPFTDLDDDIKVFYGPMSVGFRDLMLPAFRIRRQFPEVYKKDFVIPKHPQEDYGQYMNCEPYTRYSFVCQPWGEVPVDATKLIDCTDATLEATVDLVSGDGVLRLIGYDADGNERSTQYLGCAAVGVDMPLGFATAAPVNVLGAAAADGIGSMLGGSAAAIAADIGSAVLSAGAKAVKIGSPGSMLTISAPAYFQAQFFYQSERDVDHRGLPCCQNVVPVEVDEGYYQVMDGEIEAPASSEELQTIKGMLEAGFFYE